jgi:UPF0755 protein
MAVLMRRIILLLLIFLAATLLLAKQVQRLLFDSKTLLGPVVFEVKPGHRFSQISRELEQLSVIRQATALTWYAAFSGLDRRVKAGEYLFQGPISAQDVLQQMVNGKVRNYQLTIPEGWTYAQFTEALQAHPVMKDKPIPPADVLLSSLGSQQQHPEGLFFPSTYYFSSQNDPESVLIQAYRRQQTELASAWSGRSDNLPYKSPYDALIMASIIEKETGQASERSTVAGVFVRRLQKRMLLQTDPTVIYGLGKDFDGNLTRRHLHHHGSPYNTYRYPGLPPTPIALPGAESLHAALHPAAGKSLYFVAKGDGSHAFSATLSDHQRAVRKYQLRR